jgi:hypothetical protein
VCFTTGSNRLHPYKSNLGGSQNSNEDLCNKEEGNIRHASVLLYERKEKRKREGEMEEEIVVFSFQLCYNIFLAWGSHFPCLSSDLSNKAV